MNRALNVKHKIKAGGGGVASWQDQMKISTAKPPFSEKPRDRYLILESKA